MIANLPATPPAGEALMGKLIAELAKFGDMDKQQASRLARILLPHIKSHAEQEKAAAVLAARIDEVRHMPHQQTPSEHVMSKDAIPLPVECHCYKGRRLAELRDGCGK
jgi:hypothetical protein